MNYKWTAKEIHDIRMRFAMEDIARGHIPSYGPTPELREYIWARQQLRKLRLVVAWTALVSTSVFAVCVTIAALL